VLAVLPKIERALAPFGARPHWAKLFVDSPQTRYPKLPEFRRLARELDGGGKFRNDFLRSYVLGDE